MKSGVFRLFLFLSGGEILSKGISFFSFAYLARLLTVGDLGLLGFAGALISLLLPLVEYGLQYVGSREIARDQSLLGTTVSSIVLVRLVLGFVAFAGVVLATMVTQLSSVEQSLLKLYALFLFVPAFSLGWAFHGMGKGGLITLERVIQSCCYLGGIFLLIKGSGDLLMIPVLAAVSYGLGLLPQWIRYLSIAHASPIIVDSNSIRRYLREGMAMGLSSFFLQVIPMSLLILLGLFATNEQTGLFYAAQKVYLLVATFTNLVWMSFYPTLSSREDYNGRVHLLKQMLTSTAFVAFPLAAGGIVYASEIVTLIYGSMYEQAIPLLRVLFLSVLVQFLGFVFTKPLPAFSHNKGYLACVLTGVLASVVAGVFLISEYGPLGAAYTSVISESATMVAGLVFVSSYLSLRSFSALVLPIVGTIVALVVQLITRDVFRFPIVLEGIIVVASYTLFVVVLRSFRNGLQTSDLSW